MPLGSLDATVSTLVYTSLSQANSRHRANRRVSHYPRNLRRCVHHSNVRASSFFILQVADILYSIVVDFLRKNAVPNRVWFECLWVGVFWVLELGMHAIPLCRSFT